MLGVDDHHHHIMLGVDDDDDDAWRSSYHTMIHRM
jgi:hypothetical protein